MANEPSSFSARLIAFGFDIPKLRYATRVALSACLALGLGWALGLEHPQWAAMTVFAASQPTRGQILEKGFFRLTGTIIGAIVGLALLFGSGGEPWVLVIGLSVWIGLCVGLGNLMRGYLSYGTLLAGFSAAMVVLLAQSHTYTPLMLGLDRVLTVLLGVVIATVIGYLMTPATSESEAIGLLRRLGADAMVAAAAGLRAEATDPTALLARAAVIEDGLKAYGTGSLRARRRADILHRRLIAISDLLILCTSSMVAGNPRVASVLEELSNRLHREAEPVDQSPDFARAAKMTDDPLLARALKTMAAAVGHEVEITRREVLVEEHWDWSGARQAGLRAFLLLLCVGSFWVLTGWQAGPYLMLGGAVMISVFSTFDDPAWMMRQLMQWQILAGTVSLILKFVLWPLAGSQFQAVLMIMPVVLIVVPLMSHRRTGAISMDYAMALLLISQPLFPYTTGFTDAFEQTLAVISGPLIAFCGYRLIYPTNAGRRMAGLGKVMRAELSAMAGARAVEGNVELWQARFSTRLLKLIRWSGKATAVRNDALAEGLSVLALGHAIYLMRGLRHKANVSKGTMRAVETALARLARDAGRSPQTLAAVVRVGRRLAVDDPLSARALHRYLHPLGLRELPAGDGEGDEVPGSGSAAAVMVERAPKAGPVAVS
ncbi:FUSC family protein [Breoghania sp.]|uniref:FUSC family protein n=1 Tax=Breoghania sp. TaxID=2065378 RepID=UPI002AA6DB5F|nr:FUSC family protein [Breoghania sp.]